MRVGSEPMWLRSTFYALLSANCAQCDFPQSLLIRNLVEDQFLPRLHAAMTMKRLAFCWTVPNATAAGPKQQGSASATCARRVAAATAAVLLMQSSPFLANAADVAIYDHDKTLAGADFSGRDLRGAIFTKASCAGANFKGAILDGAQLDDANVSATLGS